MCNITLKDCGRDWKDYSACQQFYSYVYFNKEFANVVLALESWHKVHSFRSHLVQKG